MMLSDKLKKSKQAGLFQGAGEVAPETKKSPVACQKEGCAGVYIPAAIGLCYADSRASVEVCRKETCRECGHIKRLGENNIKAIYFYNGIPPARFLYKDFNVPRELVEEPVFDKEGNPVYNYAGQQIYEYSEAKKIDFVKKLLAKADMRSSFAQYFTTEEVLAVQEPPPAPWPEQNEA